MLAAAQLHPSWLQYLQPEFAQPYFQQLQNFLSQQAQAGKIIYPPAPLRFNAFTTTAFDAVKVVILGQDPYHGPQQAHGLSFSVPFGIAPPPSLANIFKEIHSDLGLAIPNHGNLQHWAEQGVLLLNATLSVEQHLAGSHQNKGWEIFTDRVIALLNERRENLVFLLWGAYAQQKGKLINPQRHLILKAPHPSPLSSYRGFFGCKHFSAANQWLENLALPPIDWTLPPSAA